MTDSDKPDLGQVLSTMADNYAHVMAKQIGTRPFRYFPRPHERTLGPPTPRVQTDAFNLTLQNGRMMGIGVGWEAECGPIGRGEARAIIDILTWALDNDLLVDDD